MPAKKKDSSTQGLNKEELDDFYKKLRRKIKTSLAKRKKKTGAKRTATDKVIDLLALLPDLLHLAIRLLFDKNVPSANKGALVAGIAYVVSPIDLIPDSIPHAGYVDDLLVITLAIQKFINTDDEGVKEAVEKHWAGDGDVFATVKHITDVATSAIEFIPKKVIDMIRGMFG